MSRTSPFDSTQDWLTATEAKRIVGCAGQAALMRLVVLDRIRVQNEPGCNTRYHRGDCERLAERRPQAVGA